jgi:hypothetical protein
MLESGGGVDRLGKHVENTPHQPCFIAAKTRSIIIIIIIVITATKYGYCSPVPRPKRLATPYYSYLHEYWPQTHIVAMARLGSEPIRGRAWGMVTGQGGKKVHYCD